LAKKTAPVQEKIAAELAVADDLRKLTRGAAIDLFAPLSNECKVSNS